MSGRSSHYIAVNRIRLTRTALEAVISVKMRAYAVFGESRLKSPRELCTALPPYVPRGGIRRGVRPRSETVRPRLTCRRFETLVQVFVYVSSKTKRLYRPRPKRPAPGHSDRIAVIGSILVARRAGR